MFFFFNGPTPWKQRAAAERCRIRRPPRRPRQPLARPPAASLPPAEDRRPEVAPERWQRGGGGGGSGGTDKARRAAAPLLIAPRVSSWRRTSSNQPRSVPSGRPPREGAGPTRDGEREGWGSPADRRQHLPAPPTPPLPGPPPARACAPAAGCPGLRAPGRPPKAALLWHASRRIAKPASERPPDGSVCAKPALSFHLASNAACPQAENGNRLARAGHVDPTWRTRAPFFLRGVCICRWEDLEVILEQLQRTMKGGRRQKGQRSAGKLRGTALGSSRAAERIEPRLTCPGVFLEGRGHAKRHVALVKPERLF